MTKIQITKAQFNRTGKMFKDMAKMPLLVRFFNGEFQVFGDELAIFRIAEKYKHSQSVFKGYSENLQSFYFSLPAQSFDGKMEANF